MSIRTERVADEIQKVLSERLIRGLRDPLPGFVTIRDVEVTTDFSHAKVFVSVFGSDADKKAALDILQHSRGFLRGEVGRKVRLRNTPELHFILDESAERAARVHKLLDDVRPAPTPKVEAPPKPAAPPAPPPAPPESPQGGAAKASAPSATKRASARTPATKKAGASARRTTRKP